jgi:hypothetical protein
MPDRAENNFAIMRCCARVVPLRIVNNKLLHVSDYDASERCSGNEIMAISGHATLKELVRYTKAADQARLARAAIARTAVAEPVKEIRQA